MQTFTWAQQDAVAATPYVIWDVPKYQYAVKVGDLQWVRNPTQPIGRPEVTRVVAAFFIWLFAQRGNQVFRRRLFCSIPLIGTSSRNSSLSTFCHLLASLVENRVSMTAALRVAGIGSRDADIEQSALQLAAEVEQGARLDEAASTRRQFPMNLLHVFRWSNREETFPEALHAAGEVFEGQARIQAGLVALVVEQFALIGIALSVGFIVIALFMPLIQMLNEMG